MRCVEFVCPESGSILFGVVLREKMGFVEVNLLQNMGVIDDILLFVQMPELRLINSPKITVSTHCIVRNILVLRKVYFIEKHLTYFCGIRNIYCINSEESLET